jgi:hypothetical protein
MDWLLHWYRQSSPKQNTIGLLTTYLKNDNKELTFNFLRFLSFLQNKVIRLPRQLLVLQHQSVH